MNRDGLARGVALAAGLVTFGLGLWALVAPASFYESIATFPPYNLHLLHDVGAFQLGLGATLLLALRSGDALGVALGGYTIGAVAHATAHFLDRELGGRPSDPLSLSVLALVVLAAVLLRASRKETRL
jgi:hypothetical protein